MIDKPHAQKYVSGITVTALALMVVLTAVPMPVQAAESTVTGKPDISVSSPNGPVEASSTQTLTVTLSNTGTILQGGQASYEQEVQTAEGLQVQVLEDRISESINVNTGTHTVSSLPSGTAARSQFQLELGQVEPGTYRIPIEVSYEHTRSVSYGPYQETFRKTSEENDIRYIELTVEEKPQFKLVAEGENNVFGGDTGQLAFTVKNTGTQTATDASVQLRSQSPALYFGSQSSPQSSTSLYIPSIAPGETRNLSAQVGAEANTEAGHYPIETTLAYTNENGVTEQSDTLTTGVLVQPERRFALTNIQTERFRVDESEATIQAEVVNTGTGNANNVAVRLASHPSITATNGEAAVGDLAPGESKPVSFTVVIPESAEPGTNSFPFTVEYENPDGDLRTTTSPIRKALKIGAEQNPFKVVNVSTDVSPGGSDTVAVRVQYQGDEPVTATNAKLFVSDPLSTSDDGAYLGSMEPGETTVATFTASAGSDALVKDYDASVEIRYDEQDGDTKYTDGLPIGVAISPASGGLPVPLPVIGAIVVVVLGAGYLLYRRR
jgi:hypothetical protein